MQAITRPLAAFTDSPPDLNDVAADDGVLFVRGGDGVAGRGVATASRRTMHRALSHRSITTRPSTAPHPWRSAVYRSGPVRPLGVDHSRSHRGQAVGRAMGDGDRRHRCGRCPRSPARARSHRARLVYLASLVPVADYLEAVEAARDAARALDVDEGGHRPTDPGHRRSPDQHPRRAPAVRRRSRRATASRSTGSSAPRPNCSSRSTAPPFVDPSGRYNTQDRRRRQRRPTCCRTPSEHQEPDRTSCRHRRRPRSAPAVRELSRLGAGTVGRDGGERAAPRHPDGRPPVATRPLVGRTRPCPSPPTWRSAGTRAMWCFSSSNGSRDSSAAATAAPSDGSMPAATGPGRSRSEAPSSPPIDAPPAWSPEADRRRQRTAGRTRRDAGEVPGDALRHHPSLIDDAPSSPPPPPTIESGADAPSVERLVQRGERARRTASCSRWCTATFAARSDATRHTHGPGRTICATSSARVSAVAVGSPCAAASARTSVPSGVPNSCSNRSCVEHASTAGGTRRCHRRRCRRRRSAGRRSRRASATSAFESWTNARSPISTNPACDPVPSTSEQPSQRGRHHAVDAVGSAVAVGVAARPPNHSRSRTGIDDDTVELRSRREVLGQRPSDGRLRRASAADARHGRPAPAPRLVGPRQSSQPCRSGRTGRLHARAGRRSSRRRRRCAPGRSDRVRPPGRG